MSRNATNNCDMPLLSLPTELLCEISEHLNLKRDLWSLVLTNKFLYQQFNRYLYRFDRRYCGSSALSWAATVGEIQTAQISLAAPNIVPAEDHGLQVALQVAVEHGRYEIVRLLADNGGNVNAPVDYFGNLLQVASWLGDQDMMKLLIDRGADVNAQGGHYGNALQATSWAGDEEMIKLLIGHGANINAQGGYFGNALQGASWGGNEEITNMLIEFGANINAQGGYYGDALQAASWRGHIAIVKQLIRCGAKVDSLGGYYDNARQAASVGGHKRIEGLLRYWHLRQYICSALAAMCKTDYLLGFCRVLSPR
jgi:hypothetical protein